MNKYIIPIIITLLGSIYLTYIITKEVVSNEYIKQINTYEGMKNTYIEEVYKRDDVIGQMEQEIFELRFNLESCESWCNSAKEN